MKLTLQVHDTVQGPCFCVLAEFLDVIIIFFVSSFCVFPLNVSIESCIVHLSKNIIRIINMLIADSVLTDHKLYTIGIDAANPVSVNA